MILASKMMFEWLGEKYNDQTCLKVAEAIELGVIAALEKRLSVPDLGGKLKTFEMGEAIGNEVMQLQL